MLDALDRIATEMRSIVTSPTVKGDLSSELHARLPEPYQRYCRSATRCTSTSSRSASPRCVPGSS